MASPTKEASTFRISVRLKVQLCSKVTSSLYIDLSIKAIVTALPFQVKTDPEAIAHHMYVPVNDVEDEDISVYFDKTFEFIDMARK